MLIMKSLYKTLEGKNPAIFQLPIVVIFNIAWVEQQPTQRSATVFLMPAQGLMIC